MPSMSSMLSRRNQNPESPPRKKKSILFASGLPKRRVTIEEGRTDMKSITEGSGNVFADLGIPNAEQELMKAKLTLQIHRIIKVRKLTQSEAAKILGVKQPHVSQL